MEVVLAAFITAFGGVIIAMLSRNNRKATEQRDMVQANLTKQKAMDDHIQTNGSNMTLGELAEAIFKDGRDTKNAVRRMERKVDKHLSQPAMYAHPGEEE